MGIFNLIHHYLHIVVMYHFRLMDATKTTQDNDSQPERRTVYVVEVKEVVSRSYYVVANSKKEALETYQEEPDCSSEWDFHRENSDEKVCEIDGANGWHRDFKPTVDYKIAQELVPNNFGLLEWRGWSPSE